MAFGNKDICRFNIAMNDALRVSGIERIRNLNCNFQKAIQFQWPGCRKVFHRFTFQQLHCKKMHGFGVTFGIFPHSGIDIVNRANIRMIQSGGSARFALKAFQRLRITR